MNLRARGREIAFPRRPLIMGIVNINPDSFSGDGTLNLTEVKDLARRHLLDGADILDVGGESARTNRGPISVEEEINRLKSFLPVWEEILTEFNGPPKDEVQVWPPLLSWNTWRPEVARAILPLGGHLLNDMGALPDAENARICAENQVALLIMHSVGEPKVPHTHVRYDSILQTVHDFFQSKIDLAMQAGLPRESIILDPGIDFAKQTEDNLMIYRHLDQLKDLDRPLLLPISRKTVIGDVLSIADPKERDAGTVSSLVACSMRGASLFRVHHVKAAWQTLRMLEALRVH